jgi:hypothetical protein
MVTGRRLGCERIKDAKKRFSGRFGRVAGVYDAADLTALAIENCRCNVTSTHVVDQDAVLWTGHQGLLIEDFLPSLE